MNYIKDEKANLLTIRDPMVCVVDDTYYITGTQPPYWSGINNGVHLWSSKDLINFTDHGLILKREDMPENMWEPEHLRPRSSSVICLRIGCR